MVRPAARSKVREFGTEIPDQSAVSAFNVGLKTARSHSFRPARRERILRGYGIGTPIGIDRLKAHRRLRIDLELPLFPVFSSAQRISA